MGLGGLPKSINAVDIAVTLNRLGLGRKVLAIIVPQFCSRRGRQRRCHPLRCRGRGRRFGCIVFETHEDAVAFQHYFQKVTINGYAVKTAALEHDFFLPHASRTCVYNLGEGEFWGTF